MLTILKHFLLTGIDGRKAIRRIAQPQPEGLRSSGLGAAPQQAEKPFVLWKRNGWFFAFVLRVHCFLCRLSPFTVTLLLYITVQSIGNNRTRVGMKMVNISVENAHIL